VTGFSIPEIDSLIDGLAPEEPGNPEEDQVPPIPDGPSIGQARSQRMFTALLQATEKERKTEHDLTLETAIEYKTRWEDELERRTALGIVGPDPIPHPDEQGIFQIWAFFCDSRS
jgi:hypothetical protein